MTISDQYDASDGPTEIMARKGTAAPLACIVHRTTTYTHDPVDRLREAQTVTTGTGTTVDRFTYAYDPNSNRTSAARNGQTTTSSFNTANELTSAGATTYIYDASGNHAPHREGLIMGFRLV